MGRHTIIHPVLMYFQYVGRYEVLLLPTLHEDAQKEKWWPDTRFMHANRQFKEQWESPAAG